MPLRLRLGQVLTACCAASVTLACTRPVVPVGSPAGGASAPATRRAAPGAGGADFESLLRQIGRAEDGEALTAGYIDRGAPALLAAASTILDQGRDEVRDRGARLVLMSLRRAEEFSFLDSLSFASPHVMKLSCDVDELLLLLAQSAQYLEEKTRQGGAAGANEERLPFVPALARLLLRVIDQSWPTCVRSAPHAETGHDHPQATALMLMNRMVQWGSRDDGSLARDWESWGADELRKFRQWWQRSGGRYLAPGSSNGKTK